MLEYQKFLKMAQIKAEREKMVLEMVQKLSEQEKMALEMVIDDNDYLDVEELAFYLAHDICGITTGRSGRDIAWATNSWDDDPAWTHRYVDDLEPLAEEQAADELE